MIEAIILIMLALQVIFDVLVYMVYKTLKKELKKLSPVTLSFGDQFLIQNMDTEEPVDQITVCGYTNIDPCEDAEGRQR
jgi:hypothetical protein